MTHNPLTPVTCREAAATVRAIAGLAAYGPRVGNMLRSLEACNGAGCPGHPTLEVVLAAAEKASQDVVFALLN